MRRLATLVVCAALSACAALQAPEEQPPVPVQPVQPVTPPAPASDAESLLLYYQHLRRLPAAALGREHDSARLAFTRARTDYNRLRLALVLALPGASFNDDARALEMLEPVSRNPGGPLQGLASLLAAHLQERRRLEANAQGLQQKLDALRSLERSLIERKR